MTRDYEIGDRCPECGNTFAEGHTTANEKCGQWDSPRPFHIRHLLWWLCLWLVGCVTSPAPGHCWLRDYGEHGEQVWSCTNGAQPPECNTLDECLAREGAPQPEDTTP